WVQSAAGEALLSYLLNCGRNMLPRLISGDVELTDKQREVVDELSSFQKSIPDGLGGQLGIKDLAQRYFTHVLDDGKCIASSMHDHVAGSMEIPAGCDDIERAIASLAIDVYPAFLFSPDPTLASMVIPDFRPLIARLLFTHPMQREFVKAVQRDATFKRIVEYKEDNEAAVEGDDHHDPATLNLFGTSSLLLTAAWNRIEEDRSTLETFVASALEGLKLLRKAYAGEPCTTPLKVAFAGALLPPGQQLELADAVVRAVTEAERRFVPATIKGQLSSGTDEAGTYTVINYDGDIVLEYRIPYRAQPSTEGSSRWSIQIPLPSALEQTAMRLRFSLMLAMRHELRAQLIETWRGFDNPLHHGYIMQWKDRKSVGLRAIQLTEADLLAWREWYDRLNIPQVANIELALSRILRAAAERTEPSDVLIDSVIAWESIFSLKCGVTKCLAKLLEKDNEERRKRKRILNSIYSLRSKVVHGGPDLGISEQRLCDEALNAAIQAVRILTLDRIDLLASENSILRGEALLAGP
ncbi:MAG TPA: hypothetical protein VKU87_10675, partial [Thermomicrobiaceae bacterium]|nr:hypothetical protein [Thermomicrobiaceae bacterium]